MLSKKKTNDKISDDYFLSRPQGSQVGAWASPQSQVIENRAWIDNRYLQLLEEFKTKKITRPPYWGGYCVQPIIMEFWQGRESRLHDRIQYTLNEVGEWKIERLAP